MADFERFVFLGAAYTASKHGVIGLTQNTAAFYGPKGISCNAVLPGGMNTNIGNHLAAGLSQEGLEVAKLTQGFPSGLVDTAKVAETVLFLASDAAGVVNGACLTADNGWSAY